MRASGSTRSTVVSLVALASAAASCKEQKQVVERPAPTAITTVSSASLVAKPLPPGRTPVPSFDEYASAREVTVKGSTALRCETKMVREWLRVTCRGKNDTGGTPTAVVVSKGGRGETITYVGAGVVNVITPVLEGTDFEARFSWTDKSHALLVHWPRGAPRPAVVGEFAGAASPLDRTAPSAAICDCYRRVEHKEDCEGAPFSQPDCERSYSTTSCEKLLACAKGEPSAAPICPTGSRNASVTGWCAPVCGSGRPPCAAGSECSHDQGEPPVCL